MDDDCNTEAVALLRSLAAAYLAGQFALVSVPRRYTKPYRGALSDTDLWEAERLLLRNAEELIEDAGILLGRQRDARAAALALLALEEVWSAWVVAIYPAVRPAIEADEAALAAYWRDLTGARSKYESESAASELFRVANLYGISGHMGKDAEYWLDTALRVDCRRRGSAPLWVAPSEMVDEGTAEACLALARAALEFFRGQAPSVKRFFGSGDPAELLTEVRGLRERFAPGEYEEVEWEDLVPSAQGEHVRALRAASSGYATPEIPEDVQRMIWPAYVLADSLETLVRRVGAAREGGAAPPEV